jgi:hypothetical protein
MIISPGNLKKGTNLEKNEKNKNIPPTTRKIKPV